MRTAISDEASLGRNVRWPQSILGKDSILLPCILLLGAVPRMAWALRQIGNTDLNLGEAHNAAIGLAVNGVISSPYRPPHSIFPPDALPTAHLLPLPIGIAGGVFRLFGIDTPAATAVLTALAVAVSMLSYVLFFYAFARLGLSRGARLCALLALSFVPLNVHLETEDFRFWEGGYAVALSAALLLVLVKLDTSTAISRAAVFGLVFLNALLFFVSPQLGVAGYLCLALFARRRLSPRRWIATGAMAAVALAVFVVPWAIRNDQLLGKPILLRSNLGLELTLAFHETAAGDDKKTSFERQYVSIHPNVTDAAYARMKAAGGEDAYAETLGRDTKTWLAGHPVEALRLGVRHLREYLFPPLWASRVFSDRPLGARDIGWYGMTWAYSALGLIGCAYALLSLDGRYRYAAILFVVSALPYALVEPNIRYHYIMYSLSVYFSFVMLQAVASRSHRLRALGARLA